MSDIFGLEAVCTHGPVILPQHALGPVAHLQLDQECVLNLDRVRQLLVAGSTR